MDVTAMNPHYKENRFPQISPIPWRSIFKPGTSPDSIKFVSRLLVYNPEERPNALEALLDPYFDDIKDHAFKVPSGRNVNHEMFKYTDVEYKYAHRLGKPELVDSLLPGWYRTLLKNDQR